MATYDYDIANRALVRLGASRITALNDGSKNANEINAVYSDLRDEVLRAHSWNFATEHGEAVRISDNVLTISGISKANPGVLTYSAVSEADPADGEVYLIESVVGMTEINDQEIIVYNHDATADTLEMYDAADGTKLNTNTYTAYTSGGTATIQFNHVHEYNYVYRKPTNMLRLLSINHDPDVLYQITEDGISTDEEEVHLEYIKQITDVTLYDDTFISALAWKIASEVAVAITGSMKKLDWAAKQYQMVLYEAKGLDAREAKPDEDEFNRYKMSRR